MGKSKFRHIHKLVCTLQYSKHAKTDKFPFDQKHKSSIIVSVWLGNYIENQYQKSIYSNRTFIDL